MERGKAWKGLESMPSGQCGTALSRRLRNFQVAWEAIQAKPSIALIALLVLCACLSVGLTSVLVASRQAVSSAKNIARDGVASNVAAAIGQEMNRMAFASQSLTTFIRQRPNCSQLEPQVFLPLAQDIMTWDEQKVIEQLEIDMAGVIWQTYPVLTGRLAEILYGRDLLKVESDRPGTLYSLELRQVALMGPYKCQAGFKCAFMVNPIFLPAPDESYDWGCSEYNISLPYNCPPGLCWNATTGLKWWGQVSAMLNLDSLLQGQRFRLQQVAAQGYSYRLWQANTSAHNAFIELAVSGAQPLRDPIVVSVTPYNVLWYLEIAPQHGWGPTWRAPCLAAVCVCSALAALLVLWLLVSREQHNRLLHAMLPAKVIKELASGQQTFVEEFECVTILFSDVVSYTEVAASLTPLQVLQLLNELYVLFDELSTKNGVYKVETIGDAFMAVTGCPIAEPPVAAAARMAGMAQDMVAAVARFVPSIPGVQVKIRVGLHSGPVVAGVIGKRMPRYCLFGDTVNTASRMESTSESMCVQVSADTAALLQRAKEPANLLVPRGLVHVKGKGEMHTYWLETGFLHPPPCPAEHSLHHLLLSHASFGSASAPAPGGGSSAAAAATLLSGSLLRDRAASIIVSSGPHAAGGASASARGSLDHQGGGSLRGSLRGGGGSSFKAASLGGMEDAADATPRQPPARSMASAGQLNLQGEDCAAADAAALMSDHAAAATAAAAAEAERAAVAHELARGMQAVAAGQPAVGAAAASLQLEGGEANDSAYSSDAPPSMRDWHGAGAGAAAGGGGAGGGGSGGAAGAAGSATGAAVSSLRTRSRLGMQPLQP